MQKGKFQEYKDFINEITTLVDKFHEYKQSRKEDYNPKEFLPYDNTEIEALLEIVDADIHIHWKTVEESQMHNKRHGFLFLNYRKKYFPMLKDLDMCKTLLKCD